MPERPNIVYIHSHDTGRYIQPYGHPVETPNYQRLADEGVLFRQAFCAGPTCSPSRAALLTGQSPHAAGMIGLAHRGFRLNDPKQHLAHTLKAAGYRTVLAGVQHVASEALDTLGYDVLHARPKEAETFAASFLDNTPSQPFFLDVGFNETHRMGTHFHPDGPKSDGRYCRPPAPLPDTPETRADMASYWDAARTLDAKVGVVLDALDRNGLTENTLVIATTDHGLAFPRMKCNLTDHGIGVLLILRWPEALVGGRVVDALTSQVDLFPTLCDLFEIEKPAWLTGRSLLPVLEGNADEVNDAIFSEVTYHAAYEPMRAVRTHQWKYIRRFEERTGPVLPNCDDSPSKDVLLVNGWRERPPVMEALYDLIFDPNEAHNLAADPVCAGVLAEMRGRFDAWMQETNDPLLSGPVAPPPGTRFNDPNGLSPQEEPLTA